MKFLKSLLMGTGGVALAALVLALLAPRAAHAVVATAVQVVNTSANPAITEDTSRQASQIVTIVCNFFNNNTACIQILPNGLEATGREGAHGGFLVPAGQYFVLKSLDNYQIGNTQDLVITLFGSNAAATVDYVRAGTGQMSFSSGIVAGPGMELFPMGTGPAGLGLIGTVTLHGYLTSN